MSTFYISPELATKEAIEYRDRMLALATALTTDPLREERLALQSCAPCFYRRTTMFRLVGQGGSKRACSVCSTEMRFTTQDAAKVCECCATKHNLCRHCSGHIELDLAAVVKT